jgi:hypothetical protein
VGKIRVVLADDHQQLTAIVCQTLGEEFEVVGAVENGKQAVDAVLRLNPDAATDATIRVRVSPNLALSLQRLNLCRGPAGGSEWSTLGLCVLPGHSVPHKPLDCVGRRIFFAYLAQQRDQASVALTTN